MWFGSPRHTPGDFTPGKETWHALYKRLTRVGLRAGYVPHRVSSLEPCFRKLAGFTRVCWRMSERNSEGW